MKTRLTIILVLLLILTVLLSQKNGHISETLINIINPIKQSYNNLTQNIEDKSKSYIFQKESIERLNDENQILRKRLLEQKNYVNQIKDIYTILPSISQTPISSISMVQTISYVKLNSFSKIILTKPIDIKEGKIYGLIQDRVAAGIAIFEKNQLYGYLTSDKKSIFSVFVGKNKAPGIAIGTKANKMIIKFIPKWYKIVAGDKVVTSGLDSIFFSDIPVGIVEKVEVKNSYSVAYIKTYSDIFHPKTFYLINNPKATLLDNFDSKKIDLN